MSSVAGNYPSGRRRGRSVEPAALQWDSAGLVPVVVQDVRDGVVLMVAYADREAVEATVDTGEVHFHSRSRGRLWRKGETSGNVLRLVDMAVDCDGDALLITAEPDGPTCHRSTQSCFDVEPGTTGDLAQSFAWLEQLWRTIGDRARERPSGSYITTLLEGGVDATARKVAEEATEVILAAKDDAAVTDGLGSESTRAALAGEAADLVFHLLVLLAERHLNPAAVLEVLRQRRAP